MARKARNHKSSVAKLGDVASTLRANPGAAHLGAAHLGTARLGAVNLGAAHHAPAVASTEIKQIALADFGQFVTAGGSIDALHDPAVAHRATG
ncbi:hypothetical protein BH09PLA1_BH09PLA1_17980 [soil metagenome]